MRRRYRIRMAIALLIGVAIVLLGEYWLGGRRVAVAERGNVGAEKVAPVVDADDQVGVDALKRRVADLERQLNAVLRGQARDLERKVADAEREGAALKSTVESAADEASKELAQIRQEQEIVSRMKKMRFPHVAFKPPATIIDAVDFFRSASKDYDDPDLPPEKRGFNFVLKVPQGQAGLAELPPIPTITATDISFYETLKLVSDSVDYGFKVRGPIVMVMPKADLEAAEGAKVE